jgi:2-methylcitrate dehydratase PrpD
VFGAAVAIGKLLRLNEQQMIWAIGLAATQAAGLREMFGSMAKSLHPGRAAQSGYASALLAREGFTAGEHSLEGPRGFAAVQAAHYDLAKITNGLDSTWDLRENTYKPFACGIVNHPTIDGCIQLHDEADLAPESIQSVRLRVAPLVLDLCNQKNITKGLQGKFSVYHNAAIGLVLGKAGLQEYSDETVNDPLLRKVRERVTAVGDATLTEDQAHIEVDLPNGKTLSKLVLQSLGNIQRPLTNKQLEEKFRNQAMLVLPVHQVERLIELCWSINDLSDVNTLVQAAIPGTGTEA